MTQAPSIKEALEYIANARWNENADLDDICTMADRAIATFQPDGERREAIARIWAALKDQCAATKDKDAVKALVMVRENDVRLAILASGLVQDEAAIRADEREKCAKIAEREAEFWQDAESSSARIVAANIRSAIRSARDGGAS